MRHGGEIYGKKIHTDFSVNLNPLGMPPEVHDALRLSLDRISQYPDIGQREVRRAIADALDMESGAVYAGSGASELIMAAVRAVKPERALVFEPAFSGYSHALDAAGCRVIHHILREENGFKMTRDDLKVMDSELDLVFLCDPSNPAGQNMDEEVLREALETAKHNNITVILDESFILMSDKADTEQKNRSRELLRKYDNVIIIRSLTKILAVPGIRIGYVLSAPCNIDRIIGQLPEWNLPVTGESAVKEGIRIVTGKGYISRTLDVIRKERGYLSGMLGRLGLPVFDSNTCFILFRGPEKLYDELLERGILIRDCSDYEGLSKGFFRIAVKDHAHNEILIKNMKEILNAI